MSTKYKFTDTAATYFATSTVVDWIDVFTREDYKTILLDSFRHCQQNQGLQSINDQSLPPDLFLR